ncbi:MAG: SsrA-binding protein SmpB [Patescibacteria group bacterium]
MTITKLMTDTLADNKKARFDYDILETLEAGLVLTGQEVKSAKAGHLNLNATFVTFHNGQAYLTNAHISAYQQAGKLLDYDPTHSRRLLLHKREIKYLQGKAHEKGLTVVPLKVYTKNRLIKVELGLGRGRHKYDKRDLLKKRDLDRETKQTLKRN